MQFKNLAFLPILIAAGCANQNPSSGDAAGESDQKLIGSGPFGISPVPSANPKVPGASSPNVLPPELIASPVVTGSTVVENPTTVDVGGGATFTVGHYGYLEDGPLLPAPGSTAEATKTEPDKNTYLELVGQTGADTSYDYGTHFLFQGHENGAASPSTPGGKSGTLTRVNLDADGAHRVTMMATKDSDGNPLPVADGSTWDPFAQRLLLTAENGNQGGVWQATLAYPSFVQSLAGSMGRGSYEGIQNDSAGNVWIVEDAGGTAPTGRAKLPNSFVYRFVPKRKDDLRYGKLQALQVMSLHGNGRTPIAFQSTDALTQDIGDLHSYGNVFDTKWVTLHDTDVDGTAAFDANALAKAKLATPFKRPENGQFRPGSGFKEFYFDETGDTDNRTVAGAAFGGFGAIQKLTMPSPNADTGKLTLFYQPDVAHAGFDNCSFLTKDIVVFVQDMGDTLHGQINALDSAFAFDVNVDYSKPANQPSRILAEGRDPSATIDSGLSGTEGFQNEGDNEITGWHTSNGDPTAAGILGASVPKLLSAGWRTFFTQQHGDNVTWEILKNPTGAAFLQ